MMVLTNKSVAVCVSATILLSGTAFALPENASEDAAKGLVAALTAQKLDAIAAPDPANPKRFVAALLIPDSQLLVVEAEYPNPAELQASIQQHQYRDVYAALQEPASQASRLMFLDAGCDGLKVDRDTVDVVYEHGTSEVLLNGEWKRAKLSESEYQRKAESAVSEFTRAITVLRDSIAAPQR
jgi:hypothetical protein